MKKVLAYLFVVAVASFGAIQAGIAQRDATDAREATRAATLADARNLCESENRIHARANSRDAELEKTAKLVKEALHILSQANHGEEVNVQIRQIVKKAEKIRTNFPREKLSNCEERFTVGE